MKIKVKFFSILLFILLLPPNLFAQWLQTNGPYGGAVVCTAVSGSDIFAGTPGGIFRSTDYGSSWKAMNSGLSSLNISSLVVHSSTIYAGTYDGHIFFSINNGESWNLTGSELSSNTLYVLAANDSAIFAGTNIGLFRSTDRGMNWLSLNKGLFSSSTYPVVRSIFVQNAFIICWIEGSKSYLSKDNGTNWELITSLPPHEVVISYLAADSNIYAGTSQGVVLSTDSGITWQNANSGIENEYVTSLTWNDSTLFAGTSNNGIFMSKDKGAAWYPVNNGIMDSNISSLAIINSKLLAGTGTRGIFLSDNNGINWNPANDGITSITTNSILIVDSTIYLGTSSGIFQSTDKGINWNISSRGLENDNVLTLAAKDSFLFAGTEYDGAFISVDKGLTWNAIDSGLIYPIITKMNNSSIKESFRNFITVNSLTVIDSDLYAGTGGGIFISKNNGVSWIEMNQYLNQVYQFASVDSTMLAATDFGVFLSLDNWENWIFNDNALTHKHVQTLVTQGSNVFAGTRSDGVFLSADTGRTWSPVNFGLSDLNIVALLAKDYNIFAGTANDGIFISTNNGQNWSSINSGLTNVKTRTLYIKDSTLWGGFYCGSTWNRSLSGITSVRNPLIDMPEHFSLEQNYPNPFNPVTTIRYSIPKESFVTLKVYDILGKEIATLVNERKSAGNYSTNFNAQNLTSGVYFYQLKTENIVTAKKMLLLK